MIPTSERYRDAQKAAGHETRLVQVREDYEGDHFARITGYRDGSVEYLKGLDEGECWCLFADLFGLLKRKR